MQIRKIELLELIPNLLKVQCKRIKLIKALRFLVNNSALNLYLGFADLKLANDTKSYKPYHLDFNPSSKELSFKHPISSEIKLKGLKINCLTI